MARRLIRPSLERPASIASLEIARRKPRSLVIGAAFRAKRVATRVLGPRRALNLCLDAAWLFKRFAFELSGQVYGANFHNHALALSKESLREWIGKGASVIDIGCGEGRWCREIADHAGIVVGVDFDTAALARARKAGPNHVEYIVGDVAEVLGGRHFDVALMVHLLEHIEDPSRLLRVVRAIAERLIIEVPDFDADALNLVRRATGSRWYTDDDHVREYTVATLQEHLRGAGWRIEHCEQRGGSILAVGVAA
jgi:SAM-dependent methyltransferase